MGPLLFLIYVNDIINSSDILRFSLFADDTVVVLSHKNAHTLISLVNLELRKLISWFQSNKLLLNQDKTKYILFHLRNIPGGGGGTSVMEGDRDVPLDRVWFCRSSILQWHRVSNRPNVVITIGTGYQIGLMWSSPLTQDIKIGLRLSQDRVPIVFYDRPAIQAEAMTFFFFFFFFFFYLSAQHPQSDRVYPRSTILQQGMHLNVFSKVYYDRVYFSCAERNMTGSGFDPPSGTPLSSWEVECPPPPGRNMRVPPNLDPISIGDSVLQCVQSLSFLGVTIDENLNWKAHIKSVSLKISRSVGVLSKIKNIVPDNVLVMIYNSLILSHLSYCNLAWGNSYSGHLMQLKCCKKGLFVL